METGRAPQLAALALQTIQRLSWIAAGTQLCGEPRAGGLAGASGLAGVGDQAWLRRRVRPIGVQAWSRALEGPGLGLSRLTSPCSERGASSLLGARGLARFALGRCSFSGFGLTVLWGELGGAGGKSLPELPCSLGPCPELWCSPGLCSSTVMLPPSAPVPSCLWLSLAVSA